MLTALIILSLISLLVATEAEPASSPRQPMGDEPLRPKRKCGFRKEKENDKALPGRDRLAA